MHAHRQRMPRSRRRRVLLSCVVLSGMICVSVAAPLSPKATDASWSSSAYGTAPLAAAVIAPPTIDSCFFSAPFGFNPVVTMIWHFPAGAGYVSPTNVEYAVAQGGLLGTQVVVTIGANLSTVGPVGGLLTTKFQQGLFVGFSGGSYGVFVRTVDGSTWTSTQASANASMGPGGFNAHCDVS